MNIARPLAAVLEFVLTYILWRLVEDLAAEHARLVGECSAIEQATYDREFWDLVAS